MTYQFVVRYHECDMQGRVFNPTYYVYADVVADEFWKEAIGGPQTLIDRGIDFVVAANSCHYRAPAHWNDQLTARCSVSRIGSTSFDLQTSMHRDEQLVAELSVTYVFVDTETFAPIVPPPDVREHLERFTTVAPDV